MHVHSKRLLEAALAAKNVVERAIFLVEDDDVLDADTSELVLQLGEFDTGRVAPV